MHLLRLLALLFALSMVTACDGTSNDDDSASDDDDSASDDDDATGDDDDSAG